MKQMAQMLLLIFYHLVSTEGTSNSCLNGWFGSRCQFKCNCDTNCDVLTGKCPSGSKCTKGWFGITCQYQDMIHLNATVTTEPPQSSYTWTSDAEDTTCSPDDTTHSIIVSWDAPQPFTWMRLIVADRLFNRNVTLAFKTNGSKTLELCTNQHIYEVGIKIIDIQCHLKVDIKAVIVRGASLVGSLCSVFISGGRNVALKQRADETSVFSDSTFSGAAEKAVDGDRNGVTAFGSCAHTDLTDATPSWGVTFENPRDVSRIILFNRITTRNSECTGFHCAERLKNFILESLDASNKSVFIYVDPGVLVQMEYTVIVSSEQRDVPVSRVTIKVPKSNTREKHPVLTLCEVEVYGDCSPGQWGLECNNNCSTNCAKTCHRDIGSCPIVSLQNDVKATVNITTETSETLSYCEEDRNVVTFVRTRGGATLHVPCPEFYEGNITRTCNKTTKSWTPFSQYNCTRKRLRIASNLAKDLRNQSGEDLQEIVRNISSEVTSALESDLLIVSGDIRQIVNILEEIGTVSEGLAVSNETLQNLATITDKLIAADTSTWEELSTANKTEDTGSTLLEAMDNITSTLLKSDVIETLIVKDNIVITVASTGVNKDNITFPKTDHPTYSTNQTSNRVFLSSDALSGHVAYSVIIYTNVSEKFKVHSSIQRQRIGSDVISFSMGSNSSNLSSPLILTFKTEKSRQDAVCAFLDTTSHISGVWSARGCKTFLRETTIDCHCSHLTNFAVLMSMREASPIHQAILSYVSIIGISISLFCLCLTVTVYSVMWRYVKSDRSVLHVHLCACLMLGYIVFLGGISKTEHRIACAVAAALLHYLFLAVFFVMLSQGLLILKSVTSVSATSILRYLFILMYGAPLIIVAISLGITKGEGFGTEKACWLSPNNGALWAFVGPAFTVIVVNSFILFAVIRIMQKSRTMMDKNVKRKTKSVVRSIFILAPILGVTWALGVLSVTMDLVIFQYSFAICNSLQGLFIFIFQCVLQYQIKDGFRALMRRYRASSFDSSQRLTSTGQSQGKGYSESGQKMTSLTNTSGSCKSQD